MRSFLGVFLFAAVLVPLTAQDVRTKDVREMPNQGRSHSPNCGSTSRIRRNDIRAEAVKQLTEVGTAGSLDPLIEATRDNDPQIQMLGHRRPGQFLSPRAT